MHKPPRSESLALLREAQEALKQALQEEEAAKQRWLQTKLSKDLTNNPLNKIKYCSITDIVNKKTWLAEAPVSYTHIPRFLIDNHLLPPILRMPKQMTISRTDLTIADCIQLHSNKEPFTIINPGDIIHMYDILVEYCRALALDLCSHPAIGGRMCNLHTNREAINILNRNRVTRDKLQYFYRAYSFLDTLGAEAQCVLRKYPEYCTQRGASLKQLSSMLA